MAKVYAWALLFFVDSFPPIVNETNGKVIFTAHIILLLLFVGATCLLLVGAVKSRMRIQPVRMIWYRRGLFSGAGWPALFMAIFLGAVVYAGIVNNGFYLFLGLGYLAGGVCWCVAMRLTAATIVTDFAVIRNMNKCDNVLCWSQVVDSFVREKGDVWQYTFLYIDDDGHHARFDVDVPHTYKRIFNGMVSRSIEKKVPYMTEQAYG